MYPWSVSLSAINHNSSSVSSAVNPATTVSSQAAGTLYPGSGSAAASAGAIANSPSLGTVTPAGSSPLPFDDSGLAPAAYASTCALPNLPVFNVKNYGATGNGTTDDTVAIRNALSAAQAAGGGIIYLPAGTYAVDPQSGDPTEFANKVPVGGSSTSPAAILFSSAITVPTGRARPTWTATAWD